MEENWYALLLAICNNITSKDAINYVKYGIETKHFKNHIGEDRLSAYLKQCKSNKKRQEATRRKKEKEIKKENLYNLIIGLRKEGKTWEQIGNQLNKSRGNVHTIVTRYEKRKAIGNVNATETLPISLKKDSIKL